MSSSPTAQSDHSGAPDANEQPLRERTLPDLLQERVRADPHATALVSDTATLSFQQLDVRANQLAHLLIGLGAGPERVVGVVLPRSIDAIVAMVAVLKTGAVFLPLNPDYPVERIAFMVADSAPVTVLVGDAVGLKPADLPGTRLLSWESLNTASYPTADPTDDDRTRPLRAAHPLYLIYTSGSTGAPKGVLMPALSLVNLLAWHGERFAGGPDVVVANLSAIGFDFSMHEMLAALVHGKRLAVPTEETRRDPVRLVRWLDHHGVNQVFLPNVLIESMYEAAAEVGVGLDRLTDIIQSGEPLVLGEGMRHFLREHPGLRVHNHYGATEMQDVTAWTSGADTLRPPAIGTPLWNTRVHLLDQELRPVPDGVAGDLYVSGVGLARGYLNRPGLTAERFLPDPFGEPGQRMYRTGDVARWNDDGELECLGRSDNQVKLNGFRVELGEVEAYLRGRPDVARAVVLPRENAQGGKQLIAYVVPSGSARPDSRTVRLELARVLPAHMVPAAIVTLDELPLSPNGKIDLRALPSPVTGSGGARAGTPDEELMVDAFTEVLGVADVGADDDFFALGGDSIAAVRLVIRAQRGGMAISTRDVFELGTPRRLAGTGTVQDVRNTPVRPLLSLHHQHLGRLQAARPDIDHILPVTPVQQGFLFHRLQDEDGPDVYTQQLVLRLGGRVSSTALRAAARELLARHEALRAGFFTEGLPEPVQLVVTEAELPWRETDLSHLDTHDADAEVHRLAEESRKVPFDLCTPPLLRLHLIRRSPQDHQLAIDYHHILLDGWSVTLLVRELFARYRGDSDPAPAPSTREWLRALRARDSDEATLAWRTALTGIPEPTVLASTADDRRPSAPSARYILDLPAHTTESLASLGRGNRLTVNTIVQAMWGVLLGAETGTRDVAFGTTVSGRTPDVEAVEQMIGLLINTIPVAVRIRPEESVLTLFQRLQHEHQTLAPHQHLSLGTLQRLLGWSAEFDTLLVFENSEMQLHTTTGTAEGPRVTGVELSDDTHYAISLLATPGPQLRLSLTYRPGLIGVNRIRSLAERLAQLLTAVAEDPHRLVGELPTAAGAEGASLS
ncbi:amino acid adenylation domain-containing protein [Streptomyces sp. NPDC014889]|uniref:amino acid adenylation domain-containing protein n=1 Tax=Streptomyces sp. NPDC014889 TaxID=3364928 RepID=UPI0036FCA4B4